MLRLYSLSLFSLLITQVALANPYWDKTKVPTDADYAHTIRGFVSSDQFLTVKVRNGLDVVRVQIDYDVQSDRYQFAEAVKESSGTRALIARSKHKPSFGSYIGIFKTISGDILSYDSIGTGKEYRKLARGINLRFPYPNQDVRFELHAENPKSGVMELVFSKDFYLAEIKQADEVTDVTVKELALASAEPVIRVNIYAEGYLKSEQESFWRDAQKTVKVLQAEHFPGIEHMSFYGVYHASSRKLGRPSDLGQPVPDYDTFLGLYYPYWDNFGRWTDVVYPTRESKFRSRLAVAPYDYPLILINHDGYWGVGNYMSHTAIPAKNDMYFTYLLLHEFGHFFGLNEEYEGGGRTELEFAPGIKEPWSPNITFLSQPDHAGLKWNQFVSKSTRIPTPYYDWESSPPVYGAYKGGYADSTSDHGRSHKPGLNCVMESYEHFCHICEKAIREVILF